MDLAASSGDMPAQITIKAEELSPEDQLCLSALLEVMKARKAAAAPGGRCNPVLVESDSNDGEQALGQQQHQQHQQPRLHHLSPLLQHGLYTPQPLPLQSPPTQVQETMMTATEEPEAASGSPTTVLCASRPEPEPTETRTAFLLPRAGPGPTSRPKRRRVTAVETSDGDSEFKPDSDDEPLISKRAMSTLRSHARRQQPRDRASHGAPAMPEPLMMSPAPPAPDAKDINSPPREGFAVMVTDKSQSSTTLAIPCRGVVTFEQARQENGGNYVFRWPPASRENPRAGGGHKSDLYFILCCDSTKCSRSKRGYFWRHPFVPVPGHGVPADSHFQGHLTPEQMIAQYGWHVVDAAEHLDEIEEHNAMLTKKQVPAFKRPKRQARD